MSKIYYKIQNTSIGGATIQLSDALRANNAGENMRSPSSSSYSSSWYQFLSSFYIEFILEMKIKSKKLYQHADALTFYTLETSKLCVLCSPDVNKSTRNGN